VRIPRHQIRDKYLSEKQGRLLPPNLSIIRGGGVVSANNCHIICLGSKNLTKGLVWNRFKLNLNLSYT
jgi:hypothetical protein